MPSETFTNLKKVKKEKIFQALMTEFSQYPVSEAQVARIIKEADISRGAFYKYFADIYDSYRYALGVALSAIHVGLKEELQQNPANSLAAFYSYTQKLVKQTADSPYRNFYRLYWEINQYYLKRVQQNAPREHYLANIELNINGQQITDRQQKTAVIELLMEVSHDTVKRILCGEDSVKCLQKFKFLLDVIQAGLVKKGDEKHVFDN